MVAPAAAIRAPIVPSPLTTLRQHRPILVENAVRISRTSFALENQFTVASPSSSGRCRCFAVAASKSPNSHSNDDGLSFMSQDDLNFLLKLGAGSFLGAAAIKYGSILMPDITRPNITIALLMIFTPVLVSVLILIIESRGER